MGREDLVFTRRSLVVVAVLCVFGSTAAGAAVAAWKVRDREEEVIAKATTIATAAATAAAISAVQPYVIEMRAHTAADAVDADAIKERVRKVERRVGLDGTPPAQNGPNGR